MPIYEYRCQSCDKVSEAFVRSGKEPTACPECGANDLKKLISRAGVIFKGSGFYVTDSKSGSSGSNSSPSESKDSGDSKDSSGDSKTSSDSKSSESGKSTTTTD